MPLSEAQKKLRLSGIGASDIGVLCGFDAARGPMSVYADKLGEPVDLSGDIAVALGHYMEPFVADLYRATHPEFDVSLPCDTLVHPDHNWIMATPDRIVHAGTDKWLLEIKTVLPGTMCHWGQSGTDEVPQKYLCQAAWQMLVTGIGECVIGRFTLWDGKLTEYLVVRDERFEKRLVSIGHGFWLKHVLPKIPPKPDGKRETRQAMLRVFDKPRRAPREARRDERALGDDYMLARDAFKAATLAHDKAKNRVLAAIGDANGIECDDWSATWKADKNGKRGFRFRGDYDGGE